jgi:hypothetical protein
MWYEAMREGLNPTTTISEPNPPSQILHLKILNHRLTTKPANLSEPAN